MLKDYQNFPKTSEPEIYPEIQKTFTGILI